MEIRRHEVWFYGLESISQLYNKRILNGRCTSGSCIPTKLGGSRTLEICTASSRGPLTSEICRQKWQKEIVWQEFFLDPIRWWDTKPGRLSSRADAYKTKRSNGALWLDNRYKSAWADIMWEAESGEEGNVEVETRTMQWEKKPLSETVEALELLLRRASHVPSSLFYRVLKRCTVQKDLVLGRRVHSLSLRAGHESNKFLANHIMRMYAAHGSLQEATRVFTGVTAPDTFMWYSIISAYAEHGQPKQAINLYRQMRQSALKPNNYVFVAVLRACATAGDLASGKEIHGDVLESEFEPELFIGSCLVDMYAKCGSLVDARQVFDQLSTKNVVTWTAMIAGYAEHGLGQEALSLYADMQQEGITPDSYLLSSLLKACALVGALHQGKELHATIQETGLEGDIVVGTSLVDMYAKCGSLEDSRRVFDSLPGRNVVTWNVMITGYAQHGLGQEAINLYASMQQEGITSADSVTFMGLLQACAHVGALDWGKELHEKIQERGLEGDMVVGSCLVDMYAKCGRLEESRKVFDRLKTRNVVTWNALLNGYAHDSDGQMAIRCFEEMQQQGVEPDDATFSCLLVACSHKGLVNEGKRYFQMMVEDHGIVPDIFHHTCMVDLLGRAGHLEEAENVLHTLPFENNFVGWTCLLSACKSHGDVERGRRCFDILTRQEPKSAGPYVLLGSIYANAGMWKNVNDIESLRKSVGAWKKPAKACIEVNQEVHEFTVGEDRADISSKLRSVNSRLKQEGGHVPHIELVLQAVSDKEKEDMLCGHAEKLALAYGLMNTADGTTLLVTKNLRMCDDCHSSTKILSCLEKRHIIVRDANRVHRFMNGSCSCGERL